MEGERHRLGLAHQARLLEKSGQRPVSLVVRDAGGGADNARAALESLVQEQVDGIIGGTRGPFTASGLAMVEQARIPTVLTIPGDIPPQSYVFRTSPTMFQATDRLLAAVHRAGHRRVALVVHSMMNNSIYLDLYHAHAPKYGLDLVAVESFSPTENELHRALRTVISRNPEVIIGVVFPPYHALIATFVRGQRWPGELFFRFGAASPYFLEMAGSAAEGSHVIATWLVVADQAPLTVPSGRFMRRFQASFQREHGPADAFTGFAVDALSILHNAFEDHTDRSLARDALEHMIHLGVSGVYHLSPDNHAGLSEDSLITLVVRDGTWMIEDAHLGHDAGRRTAPEPRRPAQPVHDRSAASGHQLTADQRSTARTHPGHN